MQPARKRQLGFCQAQADQREEVAPRGSHAGDHRLGPVAPLRGQERRPWGRRRRAWEGRRRCCPRRGESERSNEEEKDREAEVSGRRSRSHVYICLIGFGREAAEAKEKQEGIWESEGIDREAAPGRIHTKRSGPLNRRSDGHEILERRGQAEHRPNQTALIYRD